MKKLLLLFSLLFVVGCAEPRYYASVPPKNVKIKYIKQGTHKGNRFYLQNWDTIYRPIGDTWLTQKDIELLYTPVRSRDWDSIFKAALLAHENRHAINQCNLEFGQSVIPKLRWRNEREGYYTQFYTLAKYNIIFSRQLKDQFVKIMLNPYYKNMCTEKEAKEFVDWAIKDVGGKTSSAGPALQKSVNFSKYLQRSFPDLNK